MLSLDPIGEIQNLVQLKAKGNLIEDLENSDLQSMDALTKLIYLKDLDLSGNPAASKVHHWESLIGMCPSLKTLNGKEVRENSRIMLQNIRKKKVSK